MTLSNNGQIHKQPKNQQNTKLQQSKEPQVQHKQNKHKTSGKALASIKQTI